MSTTSPPQQNAHKGPGNSNSPAASSSPDKKRQSSFRLSFRKTTPSSSPAVQVPSPAPLPAPAQAPKPVTSPLPEKSPILEDLRDSYEVASLGAAAVRTLRTNLKITYNSATAMYITLSCLIFWIGMVELISLEGMEKSWLGTIEYVGGARGMRLIGLALSLISMIATTLPPTPRLDRIPALTSTPSFYALPDAAAAAAAAASSTTTAPPAATAPPPPPPPSTPIGKELVGLPFSKRFAISSGVLGKGQYSVVCKAVDLVSFQEVAVKCMDRSRLTKDDEKAVVLEVGILKSLKHVNIVRLLAWIEEPNMHYLVMELCRGGELFDRIVQKVYYTEREARQIALTLASCLRYMHDRGIVHRDLKPENILLANKDDDNSIKIADFGFATHVKPGGLLTSCGTPAYVAPEIYMAKPYGTSVDVWSFGVILYILLAGFPPFNDPNKNILQSKIKQGIYSFDPEYWSGVSSEAKVLIKGCLQVNTAKRYTIAQVCDHKWFSKLAKPPVVDLEVTRAELQLFNAKRKLKASVKLAIAAGRLQDIATKVKEETR